MRRALLHVESPAEAREALRRNPELCGRVRVVPPPFRATRLEPAERRRGRVLFLSRLHPVKNVEELLRAWPAVRAARPYASLVVAGGAEDESYGARLRALACETGAGDSIAFLGFVHGEAKHDLLRTSHLFVLPSHHENFGVAAVEAAAAGLPCVLSERVDAGEFLESEGVAVRCGRDAASIAAAILAVLGDPALVERCRERGPAAVDRHLSPEVVVEKLIAMYAGAGARAFAAATCTGDHATRVS